MYIKTITIAAALVISGSALASLSAEEVRQLGTTLTPWGAIKAGNKEGTIPPYDGGLPITTSPPGFVKDSGHWVDPFADEKPLYSITAKNMAQYADKLSETTKVLLKRFPTFRVDVYPTHRTVNYPKFYIDNTMKNAVRCHTVEGGLGLSGCFGGMPFPIPKTGMEAMWNVQASYKLPTFCRNEAVYVGANGTPVTAAYADVYAQSDYYDPTLNLESCEAVGCSLWLALILQKYPPRIAGDANLIKFSANPVANPNKGWAYQHKNNRVRVIQDAQYDYPVVVSAGAAFFDEINFYSGKMDRFDWRLLGKKEMIIPYNNYRAVETSKEKMTSVGGGRHPNPDVLRWELHRVNVVEATLKPGSRHAYAKRRFYIDEDYTGAGMADAWDHAGKPYRGNFVMPIWLYDKQGPPHPMSSIVYDLSTGIYFVQSILADHSKTGLSVEARPRSFFRPEELQRLSPR